MGSIVYLNGLTYPSNLMKALAVLRLTYMPDPNRNTISVYYSQLIPSSSFDETMPNMNP